MENVFEKIAEITKPNEMENLTQKIDLGLIKISALGMLINRKTELCCFVSDVAHCRYLQIKLCKDINSYNKPSFNFETKYDEGKYDIDNKSRLDRINSCIEFLEKTLNDKKIDFSMLNAIKEYVIVGYSLD